MKLSLVVPCYNESGSVHLFLDAVIADFDGCGYDYEVIFVNDGSGDNTLFQLKKLYAAHKCPTKVVSFSRNFGKEAAVYAGMREAAGEYVALIDADLQQRPAIVRNMVSILEEKPEIDVVAAYQDRRGEGKVLSFFKKNFYSIINKLSTVKLHPDASDFRCFRRCVAEDLIGMAEYHRFSKGLFAWVGYETEFIPYTAAERVAGTTKWSFRKLFNYAIDGIIGFSTAPLRMATYLGGFSALAAVLYLLWVVFEKLAFGIDIPGYATIIVLILALGAMQLICIGIIGEYVGRTFEQSKQRPICLVKEKLGCDE